MSDYEAKWYQSNKELAELNAQLQTAVTALEKIETGKDNLGFPTASADVATKALAQIKETK